MSELEEELKERLGWRKLEKSDRSISGSCINTGLCYKIDDDQSIFIKTNSNQHAPIMFEGELESLKQISVTKTVHVPKPITVVHNYDTTGSSAIVMEFFDLSPLSVDSASKLGHDLAHLHDYNSKLIRYNKRARGWIGGRPPSSKILEQARSASVKQSTSEKDYAEESDEGDADDDEENQFTKHSMRIMKNQKEITSPPTETSEYPDKFIPEPNTEEISKFGFSRPTSCGLIPQINDWLDDWIPFYARYRLDKSIRAILSDRGDRELSEEWSKLQLKVDKYFSDFTKQDKNDKIIPALLHGDLWSGNVGELVDSKQPVLYDPASFYGHSEYDFGIARMFGGLPKAFETAYFEALPKKKFFDKRNKLYQLFHHLNHWNHFGSGYRSSSLRLIKELNIIV